MKIIAKFAFVVLVVCFITMGGARANAGQTCDQACANCINACALQLDACMAGCGGGEICKDECLNFFQSCSSPCYSK
jgi:hypothetical protein